ncbi:hypothetical protein PQ465_02850 [Sphingobacterium oryzagri]|uniref:Uncharacterized protein n=1 Tax=Sphingobacterium oryzagri TaxID=3025669 RepID=A0ABY7WI96_9SPHI|nr:hypothetical protein [Sphingobacterium sp. KACC 22765]WDF69331.1 hypothetical protein PQ465_02850 [Sphingobacterium sp. KACC 22765]
MLHRRSFIILFTLLMGVVSVLPARNAGILNPLKKDALQANLQARKTNSSQTFDFYVYNFSNSSIYLTFNGNFPGGTTQHIVVPANTNAYPVTIQQGQYTIYASSANSFSMRYLMSCGYSGSGQSFTFEGVNLSPDFGGCPSLDIEAE